MNSARQLLKIEDVAEELGCCTASVYNWMHRDGFPRPIKIGLRNVRWKRKEVQAWISTRPRTSNDDE